MSDVGGGSGINNVTLTLDDTAGPLADNSALSSGTFAPTNSGAGDTFPGPAPAGPYGSALSVFKAVDPNGPWNLYVVDDAGGDAGKINGGWSLAITAANPACAAVLPDLTIAKSASPSRVAPGAPLTYTLTVSNTGLGATGAVTVTDSLPLGLTFGNASGVGWSCNQAGGVITCTRANLAAGLAPDIVITTTAPLTVGVITNTAVVSTSFDTNPANNTATIATIVDVANKPVYLPAILK